MSIPTWMGQPLQYWIDSAVERGRQRYGWPTGEPTINDDFKQTTVTFFTGRREPCWPADLDFKPMDAGHGVRYDCYQEVFAAGGGLTLHAQQSTPVAYKEFYGKRYPITGDASMVCTPERLFGHGYYEMKARLCGTGGAKLCWWMYADPSRAEIDMLEQRQDCSPWYATGSLHANNYTYRQTFERAVYMAPVSCWHYYGFRWTPTRMTWYCDGSPYGYAILPGRIDGPMHMLISLEMPSPSSTGGQAYMDYVKYWRAE